MKKAPFSGIIPPLITPLRGRDELDVAGLVRLVEYVLAGGVHGLFVLGTTGEGPGLSYRLRREVISRVCRQVHRRVPVLVGITDTAFAESVALARHAAESGADAVVLATPYYFPAGQTELAEFIRNIVAELPLPLMLYNMPGLTRVWFESETLQQLLDCENIVGLKDGSGDLEYFRRATRLKAQRPDWSVLIGPENLLWESITSGGDGGVHGGANLFPRLFVDLYKACAENREEDITRLRKQVDVLQEIYEIGKYASRYIKATKCAASVLGLCDDFLAEPFHRFHAPERARLEAILQRMNWSAEAVSV